MIKASATAVEVSNNVKIGRVSATYAAQISCPATCALRNAGCYAESGRTGIATRQLASNATSAADTAATEATAIDRLTGKLPLRLHVVGDCATDSAALTVSAAADRYTARHGSPVWTYTHAWRDVDRVNWGSVNVRASVESVDDIAIARDQGYASAIVVSDHPADGKAWNAPDGSRVLPCPEQTRGRTCVECRACWTMPNVTIAFAAHGPKAGTVKESLV